MRKFEMLQNALTIAARFFAIVMFVTVLPTEMAQAQYGGGVGVVDIDLVINESLASASARAQLEEISERFEAEIATEDGVLRERNDALQGQRGLLAEDVFNEQAQSLQGDIDLLQQKIFEVRRALDATFEQAMLSIQQVLLEEVGILAEERGMTMVFPLSQMLYASEFFDITADALARLDERVPSVEIEIDEVIEGAEEGE